MSSFQGSIEKTFDEEMANFRKNKANLMIMGGTGAGKSSLINKVFGHGVAKTGSGRPVTSGIHLYSSESSPINIFDTAGYEVKGENEVTDKFEQEVIQEIVRRFNLELSEQIHAIWYCISISNHRVFPYDIERLRSLEVKSVPLFIVFTQCDNDEEDEHGNGVTAGEYRKVLQEANLKCIEVFETSTEGDTAFDLDALIEATTKSIKDQDLRNAFIAAQLSSIPLKRDSAGTIIHTAAAAAGAAGAIPIPFSDAPIIAAAQMTMAAKLAGVYGFNVFGEMAATLLKSQLVSLSGKQLAASATKFIPYLGSVINGAVAVTFTEALGWSLAKLYEKALENYLKTGETPQWSKIFSGDMLSSFISDYLRSKK